MNNKILNRIFNNKMLKIIRAFIKATIIEEEIDMGITRPKEVVLEEIEIFNKIIEEILDLKMKAKEDLIEQTTKKDINRAIKTPRLINRINLIK